MLTSPARRFCIPLDDGTPMGGITASAETAMHPQFVFPRVFGGPNWASICSNPLNLESAIVVIRPAYMAGTLHRQPLARGFSRIDRR